MNDIRFDKPAEVKTYEAIWRMRKDGREVHRETLRAINYTHAYLSAAKLRPHSWLIDVEVHEAAAFCDHFVEDERDPWAGTYCKLLAGHDGPHSAHYPVEVER